MAGADRGLRDFPGSLFFSYFYSEGLFLFLSLAAFYHARRKQWLSASLFGFFAALTKTVGVLIVVPLLIEYFEPRLESWKIRLNRAKIEVFLLLLVPVGLLLLVYLSSNNLEAVPRQLSVVFPLFIGMALLGKNKLVHHVIVVVSVALLTLLTILSANGYWFV